ncbi:helix-turn-helix transcriptional regulator [Aestuariimicrobium sp. Y1814]|uniref:helix-turn-helix transcriptional regulator n=1 Tax=Aestuariimicrobium sp. Y1814 TaxID=3418742 RepID=UPI003DA6D34E
MTRRHAPATIGRGTTIAQVCGWLAAGGDLVTLTGPGGVGKTQVAADVVARLHSRGWLVWWRDPVEWGGGRVLARMLDRLGDRERAAPKLLVLDGCDHHLPQVPDWIRQVPGRGPQGWAVLVTSRTPLGAPGERVVPLSPLTQDEAVQLFQERSSGWGATLRRDAAEDALTRELVRRLDGLPLAIELAAARCRSLGVGQVLTDLSSGLGVLSGSDVGGPVRHRTMQATIAWSCDRLGRDEQVLLRRLAGLAAGARMSDIEAVAGHDLGAGRVHDAVDGLVRQSLLVAEEGGGARSYRMLEVIGLFARRQLERSGELGDVQRRHALHFQQVAAAGASTDSLGNIERAIDTLLAGGDLDLAARVLWDTQHLWGNARPELAEAMLARVLPAFNEDTHLLVTGTAAATIHLDCADLPAAMAAARTALEAGDRLAGAPGDPGDLVLRQAHARAATYVAALPAVRAPVTAERELAAAHARCLAADDAYGADFAQVWRAGSVGIFQGRIAEGMDLARQALDRARRSGQPTLIVWAASVLAEGSAQRGLLDEAEAHADTVEAVLDHARPPGRAPTPSLPRMLAALARGYANLLRGAEPIPGADLAALSRASEQDGNAFEAYRYRYLGALDGLRRRDIGAAVADLQVAARLTEHSGGWFHPMTTAAGVLVSVAGDDLEAADQWLARVGEHASATADFGVRVAVGRCLLALCRQDSARAEQVAQEALGWAVGEGLALETVQLLELLALAWGEPRAVDAVRLVGAATHLRRSSGIRFGPPVIGDRVSTQVAHWRDVIGPEAFAEACAEGARLDARAAHQFAHRRRGRRQRPGHGWDALSPAELAVVRAVAEGLTNPQIATRLLVSPETVKTHVSHVFNKLGVSRRAQVAAMAADHQHDVADVSRVKPSNEA